MFGPYQSFLRMVFHLVDAIFISLALYLGVLVMGVTWLPLFTMAALLAIVVFFLAAGPTEIYNRAWQTLSMPREAAAVLHAWGWVVVLLLLLAYASKTSTVFSRRTIMTWFILAPTFMIGWRVIARVLILRYQRLHGRARRVVIVGCGKLGLELAQAIQAHPEKGLAVQAFYDDAKPVGEMSDSDWTFQVAGDLEQLVEDAHASQFDEIYIALPMHAEARIRHVLSGLADTPIPTYLVPDLFAFTLLHARMADIAGMPIVSIYGSPHQGMEGFVKRVEDMVLGIIILGIIAIPMAFIALGVKLSSPGPVLFKQRRYGLSGQPVAVWKFRTMTVCEDDAEVKQAQRNDPRVTRLGAFLRRTSMDEFPQFFNVLQGHMSIVGPRPHAVVHNEAFRKVIPGYMLRHIVKPGITGWAQVNGWRGETEKLIEMEKRVEYDLEYIRNWSLWLDLKIIFLTIFKVLAGKKAY